MSDLERYCNRCRSWVEPLPSGTCPSCYEGDSLTEEPLPVPDSEVSSSVDRARDRCRTTIRTGAWFGIVSAILTLVFAATGLFRSEGGTGDRVLDLVTDPWNLVDGVLVLGLALGVLKKSRVAATLLALCFVLSKVWIFTQTGSLPVLGVVFTSAIVAAAVACFRWHARFATPPA